ncbi:MAG: ATP-dependent dethiobiotin synthetase BioD [Myxococcaceae bacterium]
MTVRGYFVTGTDTGVGKTQVSVALLEVLRARGEVPFALKPYETGGASDSEALWRAAGGWQPKASVCLFRFKRPLAPAMAAPGGDAGDPRKVKALLQRYAGHPVVVEGAGGLHVPLTPRQDVIDLAVLLGLPVVVVARAGLGTINHTTLTLLALLQRGARVAGVVLVQATRGREPSVRMNRAELERRFPRVRVVGPVPFVAQGGRRRAAFRVAVGALL